MGSCSGSAVSSWPLRVRWGALAPGDVHGLPVAAVGVVLWLGGHLHFLLRRGAFTSVLAERLCVGLAPSCPLGLDRARRFPLSVQGTKASGAVPGPGNISSNRASTAGSKRSSAARTAASR